MAYGLTFRLELKDGTPADPPSFRSPPGVSWEAGDTIPLGRHGALRVVDTRLDEGTDGEPSPYSWSSSLSGRSACQLLAEFHKS